MEQAGLGSFPELVFHQLVARVDRTVHPISMYPEHTYSSGRTVGSFIDAWSVHQVRTLDERYAGDFHTTSRSGSSPGHSTRPESSGR